MHGKQTAFAAAVDWRSFAVVQTQHQTFLTYRQRMSATRGDTEQRQWRWRRRHCLPARAAVDGLQDFTGGASGVAGVAVEGNREQLMMQCSRPKRKITRLTSMH